MARRRSNDALLGAVMVIAGIGWALTQGLQFLSGLPADVWGGIAIIVVGIGVVLVVKSVVQKLLHERAGRSAARKAAAAVNEHLPSLVRRKAQLVRPDAYGKPRIENWAKEIAYFVEEHVKPRLTPREHLAFVGEKQSDIMAAIHMRVEMEAEKNPVFQTFSDDMKPSEFETFCAEELRRVGWNARVTLQSRDQGVDVVAEKNRVRVVLQCKLYARPVGNKAVQEAAAARAHEQADYGIVVSNNRYTQDAEQLASTNDILLLHYSDLGNLDALIRLRTSTPDAWYYDDGKGQVGPLSLQDLQETLVTISNPKDVFVWCNRFTDWKRVKEVPELKVLTQDKSREVRALPYGSGR